MRLIIGHMKTKRWVEGPFEICADPETMMHISDVLRKKVEDSPSWSGRGWVKIPELPVDPMALANKAPIGWEE